MPAAANGARAANPNRFILVTSAIFNLLEISRIALAAVLHGGKGRAGPACLRKLEVIATVRIDEPEEHHCVVLMNQVVAVHHVLAVEVTEAEEEFVAIV